MKPLSQFICTVCAIVLPAVQAQAQEPNPSQLIVKDSLITVVPWRSAADITADIDRAKDLLSHAEAKQMLAQKLSAYTDTRIEVKNKEIDLIDKRIETAEEAKKESEATALKGEMQVGKQLLDILNGQKKVRDAES